MPKVSSADEMKRIAKEDINTNTRKNHVYCLFMKITDEDTLGEADKREVYPTPHPIG